MNGNDNLAKETIILSIEKIRKDISNTSNPKKLLLLTECMQNLANAYANIK